MADELIDICDENNNLLGLQKMKSVAHQDGSWHRVVHVWIYNSSGEILLQLRSKEKAIFPNMWDVSVAGHIGSGETALNSGLRELIEEINLTVSVEDLQFSHIKKGGQSPKDFINNEFYYAYFFKFDGDITGLKLQKEEVQEIRFFTTDQIETELKTMPEKYATHGDYWYEIINEVRERTKNNL